MQNPDVAWFVQPLLTGSYLVCSFLCRTPSGCFGYLIKASEMASAGEVSAYCVFTSTHILPTLLLFIGKLDRHFARWDLLISDSGPTVSLAKPSESDHTK